MPTIHYNSHPITYTFQQKRGLKHHYIVIKKGEGVILRGQKISREKADEIILKKARWILKKLEEVAKLEDNEIVMGSRMPFLGEEHEVEIVIDDSTNRVELEFRESKFRISLPEAHNTQENLLKIFDLFYRTKAKEIITPRVYKLSQEKGLPFAKLTFKKMKTRWGSCSHVNNINLNIYAVKLAPELIDYLIIHELAHTRVKNHSKDFWNEVARHLPGWKELDRRLRKTRL